MIKGAGGGSKPRTPIETPNSLVTKTTAKVLFLTSEGEVGGLADQVNPRKSVYFNNIPVQNADDTLNFPNVAVEELYGLPSQDVLKGFTRIASSFNVGTKVLTTTPATYQSSTSDVDAIRVTIRFPALFQVETNGDTNRTTVNFGLYRRLGVGAWELVRNVSVTDKTNSPADLDFTVERPAGAGTWGVQVRRGTADNTSNTIANDIFLQSATELRYAQLSYDNSAVIGVTVTADQTGSQYPTVSFDVIGIKVKVPDNYNYLTRAYTGAWGGTFSSTRVPTDNPAWILYDLLTNERYGLGVAEADIDKFSFYDAAVYNDQLVPALVDGVVSGTEPRFTFNEQYLDGQQDAWTMLQNLAASFGAAVYTANNLIRLVQDRPTNWSRVISNSNVIDGRFEYSSAALNTRTTACVVYWRNPNENWLATPSYYEDTAAVNRYGYHLREVEGIGLTTEGQAQRLAKWHVETSISNTTSVMFRVGFSNADISPGEVVKVADSDYMQVMNEAVVLSFVGNTITLDREVEVEVGDTFDVQDTAGTVQTRTITVGGTVSTLTYSGGNLDDVMVPPTTFPGARLIITGAVSPRFFKVTSVREEKAGEYMVSAMLYDANKFARVDDTPTGPVPTFQAPVLITPAPTNLTAREYAVNDNGQLRRSLLLSWSRPNGDVTAYRLRIRRNSAAWEEHEVSSTAFEITNAVDGLYEFEVEALSSRRVASIRLTGSYELKISGEDESPLLPVTNLQVVGGGVTWGGQHLNFQFTHDAGNAQVNNTLRDFEVRVFETSGDTEIRRYTVPAVAPGGVALSTYTLAMNVTDGGPRRQLRVEVRCRDANNNLSDPTTATFTNSVPPALADFTVTGGVGSLTATWDRPTDLDFKGVLIWLDTTPGFTRSSTNLVADTPGSFFSRSVTPGTTYYVQAAAYDDFSRPEDGAGLNVVSGSGAAISSAGIPSGPSLPLTGTQGDLFFNTTDNKLYRYTGTEWTAAVPTVDLTGTITEVQLADGAVTEVKLGDLSVTTDKIGDLQITTGKVADGAITGTKIEAFTITAQQLSVYPGSGNLLGNSDFKLNAMDIDPLAANRPAGWNLYFNGSPTYTFSTNTATGAQFDALNMAVGEKLGLQTALGFPSDIGLDQELDFPYYGPGYLAWIESGDAELGSKQIVGLSGLIQSEQFIYIAFNTQEFFGSGSTAEVTWTVEVQKVSDDTWVPMDVFRTVDVEFGYVRRYFRLSGADLDLLGIKGVRIFATCTTAGFLTGAFLNVRAATCEVSDLPAGAWVPRVEELLPGTIAAKYIQAESIKTDKLAANAVVAGKIAANAVETDKLAANAVTAVKIAANAVETDKLAANAVTAVKIQAGAIETDKLAANAVETDKLAANAVTTAKLAAFAVEADKIAANAVTSDKIIANAVTAGKIEASAVTTDKLDANAVTVDKLAANSVTTEKIQAGAIVATKLDANAIRGFNVTGSTLMTAGSFTTSAVAAAATTINVATTDDFPASGRAVFIDSTNDRDIFTYTGKTATTLTGCSGVLAHSSGAEVVPLTQSMVIDNTTNQMRFYGTPPGVGLQAGEVLTLGALSKNITVPTGTENALLNIDLTEANVGYPANVVGLISSSTTGLAAVFQCDQAAPDKAVAPMQRIYGGYGGGLFVQGDGTSTTYAQGIVEITKTGSGNAPALHVTGSAVLDYINLDPFFSALDTSNVVHAELNGNGSQNRSAVYGKVSSTTVNAGAGVKGVSTGACSAVRAESSGSGSAVLGESTGSGAALRSNAAGSGPHLRMNPLAARPSSAAEGDLALCYTTGGGVGTRSATPRIVFYDGTDWRFVHDNSVFAG